MIGSVFERLTVIGLSDQKYKLMCKCTCGQIKHVRKSDLMRGRVKSCGCLLKEKSSARAVERNSSHGMSRTRVYRIWAGIIDRCTNKNGKYFEHYMGRGITVCDRWKTFEIFTPTWVIRQANTASKELTMTKAMRRQIANGRLLMNKITTNVQTYASHLKIKH